MPIKATRALLAAALSGELGRAEYRTDELFGFEVPVAVPGVDSHLLDPVPPGATPTRTTRGRGSSPTMFRDNFTKFDADDKLVNAGPRL